MSVGFPPKDSLVVVGCFDGRLVRGQVDEIEKSILKLSKASNPEAVGLRANSEPIYGKKEKI